MLVYNIDEICDLEKRMEELVEKKKDAIRDNKYVKSIKKLVMILNMKMLDRKMKK